MKIISFISQKGGVGKTTLAIHLAVAFSADGLNVAILDLDPQASAAEWKDFRDCHVRPDLVLIYRKPGPDTLELVRLGSHSELGL